MKRASIVIFSVFLVIFSLMASCSFASPQVVLPSKIYKKGIYNIAPIALGKEAQTITVKVQRDRWPDTSETVLSVDVEISKDGGLTWEKLFGFKAPGGEIRNKRSGQVIQSSRTKFLLPYLGYEQRRLRAQVETFTELSTSVSIDIL